MKGFLDMIHTLLENDISLEQELTGFEEQKVSRNECLYIVDFNKNELIHKKGFENLLGYSDEEMNAALLFEGYHPQDKEIITKVIQEAILYTLKHSSEGDQNSLYLKYRRRRKDGTYITVLSQSFIYDLDKNGKRLKSITRLTDVSFTSENDGVSFSFQAKNLDQESFQWKIHEAYLDLFTSRELEVMNEMFKGITNREIGENLFISEHTVATHRKNIYKKSSCSSVNELYIYCEPKGILNQIKNNQKEKDKISELLNKSMKYTP
ncbi:LuxR C-terminal-related transcriptional regulator [Lutimonas zeaxanthinifaciens]|uniref:LuxR C-terminal-related transcriptional regulator n=1 Tax=Lutimonas zeaxanthinifaciens TaxID=3060215 RepID=UPI00265C9D3E|nr:LuxR C-terminal-related transcriptional regulator [Lutimonas sp. YSD2104]WKK66457.1 LuxR C-terminal-related transcriptional regulator [Lutimonas sp. YSD2104]